MGNPAGHRIWAGAPHIGVEPYGEHKGWWRDTGRRIQAHEWALARTIEKGKTSLNETIEIECFDGSYKIIRNSAVPVRDPAGRLLGASVINEDITEQDRVERQLLDTTRRLQFHLQNTPLAVVSNSIPNFGC